MSKIDDAEVTVTQEIIDAFRLDPITWFDRIFGWVAGIFGFIARKIQ
jgi:hypothetical protein